MRAVDTNVVVRLVLKDDAKQWARAHALFRDEAIWISLTVVLELEWVLRSVYQFDRAQAAAALSGIAGLENVSIENAPALAHALKLSASGMDFADALHLAVAAHLDGFLTFDSKLVKQSRRLGLDTVSLL